MKSVRVRHGKKRCQILSAMYANIFGNSTNGVPDKPDGNQPSPKAKIKRKIIPIQKVGREYVVKERVTSKLSIMVPLL